MSIEMPGFKPRHEVKAMLDDADVLRTVDYRYGWRYGRYSGSADGGDSGRDLRVVSTVHSGIPELVEAGKSAGWCRKTMRRRWRPRLAEFGG